MNSRLKKAWKEIVTPEDLDTHMEYVGQAKANAFLVESMLTDFTLSKNSSLSVPGCGTGQIIDYLPKKMIDRYRITFSDINKSFLRKLRKRLVSKNTKECKVIVDDLENTRIRKKFDAYLVVLVLEHIDWRKGIQGIIANQPRRLFFVIQCQSVKKSFIENSNLRPSIKKFLKIAKPHLVKEQVLLKKLSDSGFVLRKTYRKTMPDGKVMLGIVIDNSIHMKAA
jgi:SAM-dependent methyltransferase